MPSKYWTLVDRLWALCWWCFNTVSLKWPQDTSSVEMWWDEVHYYWPGPIVLCWWKVVHYIGNWVPFGTQPGVWYTRCMERSVWFSWVLHYGSCTIVLHHMYRICTIFRWWPAFLRFEFRKQRKRNASCPIFLNTIFLSRQIEISNVDELKWRGNKILKSKVFLSSGSIVWIYLGRYDKGVITWGQDVCTLLNVFNYCLVIIQ